MTPQIRTRHHKNDPADHDTSSLQSAYIAHFDLVALGNGVFQVENRCAYAPR